MFSPLLIFKKYFLIVGTHNLNGTHNSYWIHDPISSLLSTNVVISSNNFFALVLPNSSIE